MVSEVARCQPQVVCVAAVPPFAYMHIRYVCRRLRSQFKDLKLATAFLTEADTNGSTPNRGPSAADAAASSLAQAALKTEELLRQEGQEREHALTPRTDGRD